jgi:hypothetical protein
METAFAPYDGAHAEQSAFTKQLIEETIAEYDAARATPGNGPAAQRGNGNGSAFTPNGDSGVRS